MCRIVLSRPSLFLHLPLSSLHSEASSEVFSTVLQIRIHIAHINTTYQTSSFIYSLLSSLPICSTLILFTFLLFPSSSEFFSFRFHSSDFPMVRILFRLSCSHSGLNGIPPSHLYYPLGAPGTSTISDPTPDIILTAVRWLSVYAISAGCSSGISAMNSSKTCATSEILIMVFVHRACLWSSHHWWTRRIKLLQ